MSADTVSEQPEVVEQEVIQEPIPEAAEQQTPAVEEAQEQPKEDTVPLTALQKERKKRQEAEYELKYWREQQQAKPQEPDESLYEAATREDLGKAEAKIIQQVEERSWIRHNPERAEYVNENLTEFLKRKPHLALAIEKAPNRYEEAWELMNALTPKQREALKPSTPKRTAPGNPAAVPKATAMNESLDLGSMSDKEFNEWRASKRRRR